MSFGDLYTATPGSAVAGNAPGLPPIDLPKSQARPRTTVTVHPLAPEESEVSPWASRQKLIEDKEQEPEIAPWASKQPAHTPELERKIKEQGIGTGEAALRGVGAGVSFGFGPFLEGLAAASGEPEPEGISGRASGSSAARPVKGLINLLKEHGAGVEGPAMQAFRQVRDEEQAKLEESRRQHPIATFGGEVGGSLLSPVPGQGAMSQGASLGGRLLRGAGVGAAGGALYGAGTAASKGEDVEQALGEVAASGAAGAGFGSLLHGIIGPRLRPTVSPGQAAARTAEELGAPIPKGLASDNTAINAFTSKLRSFPIIGSRVSDLVDRTQQAAGERVANIAGGSSGIAPNRALAGQVLRPALRDYQQANKDTISKAYELLNQVSDTHLFAPRVATGKAVETIIKSRRGARLANPESGLEDVLNMLYGGKGGTFGGGISFRGLQQARSLLGEKLQFPEQHPGFRIGDGRLLYKAMSEDMEYAVRRHAIGDPNRAAALLNKAHEVAKEMIERNTAAQRILNISNDESLVGALVHTAQETSGNLRMLQDLKSTMKPQEFEQIGGVLLHELGMSKDKEFSLRLFANGYGKISDGAKQILFSPQHKKALDDIFGLGKQIKYALKESNTSHTAGVLVAFDLARDAIMMAAAVGTGAVAGSSMALSAAAATPGIVLAHWLASPAKAASLARWTTAYRALTLGIPTPARRAAFNIATRNLANTLGVPAEAIAARALGQQQPSSRAALPTPRQSPASTNTGSRVVPTAGSLSLGR